MVQEVRKLLLEKIIPSWGVSSELQNGQGTHFTGQVIQSICNIWPIFQYFHCAFNPQSSGLVKHTNGIIKTQLAKLSEVFNLSWPKAVSLVLFNLWSTPFGKHHLSLFQIIIGRPKWLDEGTYELAFFKGDILHYCHGLRILKINQEFLLQRALGRWSHQKSWPITGDFFFLMSLMSNISQASEAVLAFQAFLPFVNFPLEWFATIPFLFFSF